MSLQMRVIAQFLRVTQKRKLGSSEKARDALAKPKGPSQPPAKLGQRHDVTRRTVAGFECYAVRPRNPQVGAEAKSAIYLHGGGYISEIVSAHWDLIGALADAGVRVDVPLYGLAPAHTWREAYSFVTAVYRDLVDETGAARVAIVGDSAGAGLALGIAQSLLTANLPQPGRLVLISPWLDLTLATADAIAADRDDPWLSRVALVEWGLAWAAGDDPRLPQLSPINGPTAGLAPTTIYIGTRDQFYPDVVKLRAAAAASDLPFTVHECVGGLHVYPLVPAPEGRAARAQLVAEIAG